MAIIIPGPSRYPEGGGMAPASVKRGENLLNAVLGAGNTATTIDIAAEGPVEVYVNGEELKAHSAHGDIRKFFYKGEGQALGGKKYGTIRSLEIVGSGKFNLIIN
jgi:hypothetical protein